MKRPTSSPSDASGPRANFGFLSLAAGLSLPLLLILGCQGELEGNFPAQMGNNGTGGAGPGSGGSGSGGSGSGGSGSGGSSAGCDAPVMVFEEHNCGLKSCHGVGDTPPVLAGSDLGPMLKSQKGILGCEGENMVDPAMPKNSVLYKRVAGEDCGAQMPFGSPLEGAELTDALTCLSDWISKL